MSKNFLTLMILTTRPNQIPFFEAAQMLPKPDLNYLKRTLISFFSRIFIPWCSCSMSVLAEGASIWIESSESICFSFFTNRNETELECMIGNVRENFWNWNSVTFFFFSIYRLTFCVLLSRGWPTRPSIASEMGHICFEGVKIDMEKRVQRLTKASVQN